MIIAGIALGVVLTFRGSGVINLATGAMAMLGGYAYWSLTTGKIATLPMAAALPLSLLFVVACGALVEFAVFRPLRTSSPLARLMSSLGVLLIAQAACLIAFGTTPQPEPTILPQNGIELLGAPVGVDLFILTGLIIVVTVALWAVFKWTRFGLATRAAAENESAAMLGGLSPARIAVVNTLVSSLLAGAVGILAASITQLDPETLPLQIIPALAAALLASFTSFWIATASAFGISILYSIIAYMSAQTWFPQSGGLALPGVTDLLAFLIIIGVLFWRGARLPGRGELVEKRLPEAPRPQHLWRTALICAIAGAILLIIFPYDFREALINTLIGAILALSLVVITGYVGQISVVQLALAGASGFTVSHMAENFHIPFPFTALIGIAVAVAIGVITAFSAVRVRGVSLAVVTLAGAVAIQNFGFTNTTWGGGSTGSAVPELKLFGLDLGTNAGFRGIDGDVPSPVFGWVALACCVLLCVLVGFIRRGRLGQRMLAVRSNERAASAAAINPRTVKLYAFTIAAFIAGVAGVLYAYDFGSVSENQYDVIIALSLIAFAYAGGITLISGAIFAGLVSAGGLIPQALLVWFGLNGNWFQLFGGVILIFTLLQNPAGVAGDIYRRTHKRPEVHAPDVDASTRERITPRTERPDLSGVPDRAHGRGPVGPVRRRARAVGRVPERQAGRARRPHRPQRRGQDHAHRRHLRVRVVDRHSQARRAGPARPAALPAGGRGPDQDLAVDRAVRRPQRGREPHGRGPRGRPPARTSPRRRWRWWGWTGPPRRCRPSSRPASASSSASPARWSPSRRCCAWTSPRPGSTRPRARSSGSPSGGWPTRASRCC